jgi:cyclopropane fatty-acyl-phospholipid synthase-like methyltransferase
MKLHPWEEYYSRGSPSWRGTPFPLPDLPEGSEMLDLGCGTGPTVIRGAEKGYRVKGLDLSGSAINIARERLRERGLNAKLMVADLNEPDLDPGRFDLITAHYILGTLVEREALSKRISGWLKEGGLLSFEDLAVGDMREGKGTSLGDRTFMKGNGIIQHFFTREEVRGLFSGLHELECTEQNWKHGGMPRKRIRAIFQSRGDMSGRTSGLFTGLNDLVSTNTPY